MGIHSKVWGQYLWRTLHTLTYSYDPKMPDELKSQYVKLFHVLKDFIPCPICRAHYTKRCNANPPEKNMKTTESFVTWLNNLHNEVNSGLGKPLVSRKYADNYYIKDGKLTYDFRDFVILFRIMTMITNLNFPAIKKFIELLYNIYPKKYMQKNAPKSLKIVNNIENNSTLNAWIIYFDHELAESKKTKPYLNTQDINFVIENSEIREITKNMKEGDFKQRQINNVEKTYNVSRIVKNDIDVFLKKYKII